MVQFCVCEHRKNSHHDKKIYVEPSLGQSASVPIGSGYYTTQTRMVKQSKAGCSKCSCKKFRIEP